MSWRKGLILSAAFLMGLSVATSCKKRTNTLGIGALNPESLLASGGIDTFSLLTYTEQMDTATTHGVTRGLVGYYNDPKFGTFKSDFYMQFHPTSTIQFSTVDGLSIDSVVLSFRYAGYYGSLDPQTFAVHRLDEDIYIDTPYYKNTVKQVMGSDLVLPSSAYQTPNVEDSVIIGSVRQAPQLRLQLDPAFGTELIMAAYNQLYTTDDSFDDLFKGLRISVTDPTPASGDGAILYLDAGASISRLTIYYKLGTLPNAITYEVDSYAARFNHVDIDNSGHDVMDVITDHLNGQDQYYAQAFQSRAVVKIPGIEGLPENAVVHDALLVIPISYQTYNVYYPSAPIQVGYYFTETDGTKTLRVKNVDYDIDLKRYVIDVRDFVQDVVMGNQENVGIYLFPPAFSSTAERIVFNGPNTTNKLKPKLIIKYTEY